VSADAAHYDGGVPFVLRDGSRVLIRPIRREDRDALRSAFERLSAESRYRRFLVPMASLSEGMLDYLTAVDHHRHEALVAIEPDTRTGLAVARFVRLADRPGTAEFAVTVDDAWQGRGLGSLLLEALAARARQEGITRFSAVALAENSEVRGLLGALGPLRVVDREQGTVEVEIELPERGIGPQLRALLRLARVVRERD
jgi:GNAT superfamily N-acetyltransferase